MLGSGPEVLFLPSILLTLGWVAGLSVLLLFALITLFMSLLLASISVEKQNLDWPHNRKSCSPEGYQTRVSQILGKMKYLKHTSLRHKSHKCLPAIRCVL